MLVESVMRRQIATVQPDATAREAARRMQTQRVGSLLVARGGTPLGIVTERDLVGRVLVAALDPDVVKVQEFMSKPLATIEPSATIEAAAVKMQRLGIKRLAVVLAGNVVGMLSVTDIAYQEPEILRRAGANEREPEWRD